MISLFSYTYVCSISPEFILPQVPPYAMPFQHETRRPRSRQRKPVLALFVVMMIGWWWTLSSSHAKIQDAASLKDVLSTPQNYFIDDGNGDSLCLAALASSPCQRYLSAWRDWTSCMQKYLESIGWYAYPARSDGAVADFIYRCRAHLPWSLASNHTAVLLEFRPLERRLRFSVNNIMWNLPIHWRLQIVGGPDMCRLAFRLFRVEIAAEKVIITSLDYEKVEQVSR